VSTDPLGEPHSAAYFDEQRDFWWNLDYVRLVAARLELARARSVLDLGAGLGHWGRTLLPVLSPQATVVGLERDHRWVAQASAEAARLGLSNRCSFQEGVAEALPFEDETFDLVTCQTLLIHVADPAAVIAEMRRVVAPGGMVLLSEPNNLAGLLVADSNTVDKPLLEAVERIEFALICERAKTAVGVGNSSVGDLLPGLPARYFLAGGGLESEFEARWQRRLAEGRETGRELAADRLDTAGGGIHHLTCGRRPTK
jgi:ubiquinone/menaquinone biosynthesis C-methylase UbiE